MREPGFWWRKAGLTSALLTPLGLGSGAIAAKRMARRAVRGRPPGLRARNFTLGVAAQTPPPHTRHARPRDPGVPRRPIPRVRVTCYAAHLHYIRFSSLSPSGW